MTKKKYLALSMLASALWGVSYPVSYLALRLYGVNDLITLSYLVSTILLSVPLLARGFEIKSVVKGVAISPVNYALNYLYIRLTGDVDGLAALAGSSYIIPLIIIDYMNSESLNTRHVASAIMLLLSIYLLYQGYYGSLAIALLMMVINLVYTIALDMLKEAETISMVFGQSLGTLVISCLMALNLGETSHIGMFNVNYIYYPLVLSLVGVVLPYVLYSEAIKHIGPVSASLTSSIEILASIASSAFLSPPPVNPAAWLLLALSIILINVEPPNRGNVNPMCINQPAINDKPNGVGISLSSITSNINEQHGVKHISLLIHAPGRGVVL